MEDELQYLSEIENIRDIKNYEGSCYGKHTETSEDATDNQLMSETMMSLS